MSELSGIFFSIDEQELIIYRIGWLKNGIIKGNEKFQRGRDEITLY